VTVGFSRVTLIGTRRRVDVVLPADEPVGRLLPDLLELTNEPAADPPRLRHLSTPDGRLLQGDDTLAAAEVADGTHLRLVGSEDAPPAPVVHDVTEETAADLDARAWRWGAGPRTGTAAAGIVVVTAAVTLLAYASYRPSTVAGACGVAAAALLLGGLALAGPERRPLGAALVGAGGVAGAVAAWAAVDAGGWSAGPRAGALVGVAGVTLVVLGFATRLRRGGVIGGAVVLAFLAAWFAAGWAGLAGARLGAVLGLASVMAIGVLPRVALATSGLALLDDRRTEEREVPRREVSAAIGAAHTSLVISTVASAASAAVAGWLLAREPSAWTVSLALAIVLVLVVRVRMYPLLLEVLALVGAAAMVLLGLWLAWVRAGDEPVGPLLGMAAAAVLPVLVLTVDPPGHTRARLRRLGDRLEALAVVVMPALAVGVFDVFRRLLDAF
jgi:ESX secretion system protein EccD